jgi:hypothetical protein
MRWPRTRCRHECTPTGSAVRLPIANGAGLIHPMTRWHARNCIARGERRCHDNARGHTSSEMTVYTQTPDLIPPGLPTAQAFEIPHHHLPDGDLPKSPVPGLPPLNPPQQPAQRQRLAPPATQQPSHSAQYDARPVSLDQLRLLDGPLTLEHRVLHSRIHMTLPDPAYRFLNRAAKAPGATKARHWTNALSLIRFRWACSPGQHPHTPGPQPRTPPANSTPT